MKFEIHSLRKDHLAEIVGIHNAYVIDHPDALRSEGGFFLRAIDANGLSGYLQAPASTGLVAIADGRIVAYLLAKKIPDCIAQVVWSRPDLEPLIHSPHHWHIEQIATAPAHTGTGIARALYHHLSSASHDGPLSCYISTHPHYNRMSMRFHHNNGFLEAAEFSAPEFIGIKDYKSVLLIKP